MPPAEAEPSTLNAVTDITKPSSDKRELRRIMKLRRAEAAHKNPEAGLALRDRFLAAITLPPRAVVAGYVAQDYEIDPRPLLEALATRGHQLALPVVRDKDWPMVFRAYSPRDELVPQGLFNIPEPDQSASLIEPDVVLTPLLAFDASGNRLGRGGGYYDRTLESLRKRGKIIAIGLAYACQKVDTVPNDSMDSKLDKIVTETKAFEILKSC